MIHFRPLLLVCYFIIVGTTECISQLDVWSTLSLEKKVIRKTRLKGSFGYRVGDSFDDYLMFGQLRATRKLKNKIKLKLGYRYTKKENAFGTLRLRHRGSFMVTKQWKIKKYKLNYRSNLQIETQNQIHSKKTDLIDYTWRQRVSCEKKIIKKLFFNGGGELFLFENDFFISNYRLYSKVSYSLRKKLKLGVGYVFNSAFMSSENPHQHVLTSSLSYRF